MQEHMNVRFNRSQTHFHIIIAIWKFKQDRLSIQIKKKLLLYLGYIVALTKVPIKYQIYHSWIQPLHHFSFIPQIPNPRIFQQVSFFHLYTRVYSAIKKNKILPFADKCVELETIILSEVSQVQKATLSSVEYRNIEI
jgi:hypothetical protein